jgi:shikimate 5-dehydrogenase
MEHTPTPSFLPTGRTRVLSIIGHPIKQVRSPIVVNTELARRGIDAVLVPIDIEASALGAFFTVLRAFENTPGAIVTIPHKIASVEYVDALSDRARLLGAVNMVRRLPGGRLEGDMSDGLGFLAAAAQQGVSARGKSVAVFGGGAVGRAMLWRAAKPAHRGSPFTSRMATGARRYTAWLKAPALPNASRSMRSAPIRKPISP